MAEGTPFITLQEPSPLTGYDAVAPASEQPSSIPKTFVDAMRVRQEVFVKEQGVPQEFEYDEDDKRSCHWVVYASVNHTAEPEVRDDDNGEVIKPRKSVTTTLPVGTIRLVPFPHPPHPRPGGVYVDGKLVNAGDGSPGGTLAAEHTATGALVEALTDEEKARLSSNQPYGTDRATDLHDGKEPYVKLGRLAVIKEFRRHKLGRLLVSTALNWMASNPSFFNPSVATMGFDQLGINKASDIPKWNGLVCCHAQEAVVGAWEKLGFKVDEGMGRWYEEGILHVGMFQRLQVKQEQSVQV